MWLRRVADTPLLTAAEIRSREPRLADPSSVFNPGALRADGRVHLMLRVQSRGRETFLVMAASEDGLRFTVAPEPIHLAGLDALGEPVHHVYDARLTTLDGLHHALVAVDLDDRCELGLLSSADLRDWQWRGLVSRGGNRNGVLFPARVGGRALRLDRPNRVAAGAAGAGDAIWLSESDDLLHWRPVGPVAAGRPRSWDELLGPGPPPVLTEAGWLALYHGVATHHGGVNVYQAGALLLDADDPTRVLARTRNNLLEPRLPWELSGQVPNVVFPSGMVLPTHDGPGPAPADARVLVYYGAADTCIGVAESTVGELIRACQED